MESRRRVETETDSNEDTDYEAYVTKSKFSLINIDRNVKYDGETQKRRPRCYSKNALMARENRLKKKMYIESLEKNVTKLTHDNKKLQLKVDKQADRIKELLREVRYVKSVLANSADISNILRSIRHNTGMLVGTSLDKSLSLTSNYVSNKEFDKFTNFSGSLLGPDDDNLGLLFNDPELNLMEPGGGIDSNNVNFNTFDEHNYTTQTDGVSEDAGVCLHVSKHRVSLEFCPSCNDNAATVWSDRELIGSS